MLRNARDRAKVKGLECTIKLEDIKIPTHCPALGIPLIRTRGAYNANTPSLDRIDSSKGYTPDNIQVISFRANSIKSNATPQELLDIWAYASGHPRIPPLEVDFSALPEIHFEAPPKIAAEFSLT